MEQMPQSETWAEIVYSWPLYLPPVEQYPYLLQQLPTQLVSIHELTNEKVSLIYVYYSISIFL